MAQDLLTLIMLILLQAVLGFDNLLYISLESKRAPKEKQAMVRGWGIGLAMVLRIILLFVLVNVIKYFQEPILPINWGNFMTANFNIHGLIVVIGGAFIIYTAMKEIWHMLRMPEHEELDAGKKKSVGQVITLIVIMNLVFSFDSILSALALTNVFWVMATAIIIGGLLMIWLSGKVSEFLEKNRMYEVLGLFILFVVGIMLLTEGGEIGKLHFFGKPVEHMEKTTFYFVVTVLVLMELVQSGYKKNLERKARKRAGKDG